MTPPDQTVSDSVLAEAQQIMREHDTTPQDGSPDVANLAPPAAFSALQPSELLDEELKQRVLDELTAALPSGADSASRRELTAESRGAGIEQAINNKARDELINRLLDLIFHNPSERTRRFICGSDFDRRKDDYAFWTKAASFALDALPLLAGAMAVAAVPATIAAVALVLARYGQEHICSVKLPPAETRPTTSPDLSV